jgi:hypothetical protein
MRNDLKTVTNFKIVNTSFLLTIALALNLTVYTVREPNWFTNLICIWVGLYVLISGCQDQPQK